MSDSSWLLPRDCCADAREALTREWLVSNGLGGYAAGTVAGANTRRYHGLLVAALKPPLERTLLVAKADATAHYRGSEFALGCNEFADGTLAPRGCELLREFRLEGTLPVWTFALGDALLELRIWMAHGHNTTYVRHTLRHATAPVQLELVPLCTYRDYHAHGHAGWSPQLTAGAADCLINAWPGARPYRVMMDRGSFTAAPDWYYRFHHRLEAGRGLDAEEDLFRPGLFRAQLEPGQSATLILSAEAITDAAPGAPEPPEAALVREQRRQSSLLRRVPEETPAWVRRLTLAADQFIVARTGTAGAGAGTTVIAGYPWFGDWGRDTMIALPGLALATGRHAEAASILRTFAGHVSQGMLPNRFPDGNEAPEYNTADATLWYFHAVAEYLAASGDTGLLTELYPVLQDIIGWHQRGTRFGIRVDDRDGLLLAGERGVQLTWMDAKVGDWVVTPRIGKPVEINALWHHALLRMSEWATLQRDRPMAAAYALAARRAASAFGPAFWYAQGGYLYDVVDGPDGDTDGAGRRVDAALRPNQIFAVSLGTDLLSGEQQRAVVETCGRALLTPVGLRSLAPTDPAYVPRYEGGPLQRDGSYHQGTVWSWLLGPYALAHQRVYGDADYALELLAGIAPHLQDACLGSISEIFDAAAPHAARGCCAQAWSVAEVLRAWHRLQALRAANTQAKVTHA
jgi:predicted glycogen debranching enzyme